MGEEWGKLHSWLRHRLIQRAWGWNEHSDVKDQEGAWWFGVYDRRVIGDEIGEAQATAEGFCHVAEILFIPLQCSYRCWTIFFGLLLVSLG